MTIDILYLARDRLAFTQASFAALLANTDWDAVSRLVVYDDGSEDDARDWLGDAVRDTAPVPAVFRPTKHLGPVGIMRDYLDRDNDAAWFAKIDNDCAVPPDWLTHMAGVTDRNPDVELLGMEAGMTQVVGRDGDSAWDGQYRFEPATNIGGIGLFRTHAFTSRPRLRPNGRWGFTEWQVKQHLVRGWITPDLPVVLLDRLPFEPWLTLSRGYVDHGWQRDWPKWDPRWMNWAWKWMTATKAAA